MGASVSVQHVDFKDTDGAVKRAAVINFNVGNSLRSDSTSNTDRENSSQRVEIIDETQPIKLAPRTKNEELRYNEKILIDAGMLLDYITPLDDRAKKRGKGKNRRRNKKYK